MSDAISLTYSDNHSPREAIEDMSIGDVLLVRNTTYLRRLQEIANENGLAVKPSWEENPEAWRAKLVNSNPLPTPIK